MPKTEWLGSLGLEKHGDLERGRISCHTSRAVYVIGCLVFFTSAGLDKSLATSQNADQITIQLLNSFYKYSMNVNRRLHLLINELAEV